MGGMHIMLYNSGVSFNSLFIWHIKLVNKSKICIGKKNRFHSFLVNFSLLFFFFSFMHSLAAEILILLGSESESLPVSVNLCSVNRLFQNLI